MNASPSGFLMPREQVLSREYLSRRPRFVGQPRDARPPLLFFWARNALYYGVKALSLLPGDEILLPAYLCDAAVQPAIAAGARTAFYQVRRDCSADFADIEAKIGPRTRALMVVHYFGFPQAPEQFRRLCDRHGLFLIEDCAHVLRSSARDRMLGDFGDISIFSWRKFLPIYDGGELTLRNAPAAVNVSWAKESPLLTLRIAKTLLEQLLQNYSAGVSLRLLSAFRQAVVPPAAHAQAQRKSLSVDRNSALFDLQVLNWPMTRISRLLLYHSDIEAIAQKRRSNFLWLHEKIVGQPGLRPLFPVLPPDVCPWVYPLFFEGSCEAHLRLRSMGIPATTWGFVRPTSVNKERFPDAEFLYEKLVFIPVHQNLAEGDLQRIVRAIYALRGKAV